MPCRSTHRACFTTPRGAVARAGFTLVELLVVIGIIALLMSILLPTLSRVKEQANRIKCASNLRQVGLAMTSYANQYRGMLPMYKAPAGVWLWDIPTLMRDDLVSSGSSRDILYCPSNEERNHNGLWDFNGYTVAGFFMMHKRHPNAPNAAPPSTPAWTPSPQPIASYPTDTVKKDYVESVFQRNAAEREFASDAVLAQNGSFVSVIGGFGELPDRTNHLSSELKPQGGNVLFLDGHLSWRPFSDMKMRSAAGNVSFWF